MTPIGYLRKVEKFALYLRDTKDEDRTQAHIDVLCEAIDQAWKELSSEDRLVVYNTVQFIHNNILPAKKAEPEKPRIQLLN